MLENQNEIKKITSSLIRYFDSQNRLDISRLLKASYPSSEEIGYDNWNGGRYFSWPQESTSIYDGDGH